MSATRQRVVIRPLKEELEHLGILEQDDEEPAPEPDPEGGYAGEEGDDEPKDEPDMATESDDGDEDDAEGDKGAEEEAVQAISTLSKHFLGVHEQDGEMPVGDTDDDDEEEPEGPEGEPVAESRTRRLKRLAEGKLRRPTKPATRAHNNRITALLEDVSKIVGDIHRVRREERIKGFAQIAVIAETLHRRFHNWGMALSEGGLYRVGDVMKKLSEQAADMAIGLDTPPGEEPEDESGTAPAEATAIEQDDAMVDEMFKKLMAKLLDALQLYNDVTGKGDATGEQDEIPGDDDEDEPEAPEGAPPGIRAQAEPPMGGEPEDDEEPEEEDDEEPPPFPPPSDEDDDDDEDDLEPPMVAGCQECSEDDDEGPYGNPPEEEPAVTEARRVLSRLRAQLEAKGKKGKKRPLKSAHLPGMTRGGKVEKKGKKGKKRTLKSALPGVHYSVPGSKKKKK